MPDLPAEVQDHIVRGAHGYLARWRRDLDSEHFDAVIAVVESEIRRSLLLRSADLLDYQAAAHKESVVDYTDLLRVWAEDNRRWEQGR